MLPEAELREALSRVQLCTIRGPWVRRVSLAAILTGPPGAPQGTNPRPLWPGGPRRDGARFVPRDRFDALHLASDAITAVAEGEGLFRGRDGRLVVPLHSPEVDFRIEGVLIGVLDLADRTVQTELGTTVYELTGDWRLMQIIGEAIPTQILGQLAYESGRIVAIRYMSTKNPNGGQNIVVLTDRLSINTGNFVEVFDPTGVLAERLPWP